MTCFRSLILVTGLAWTCLGLADARQADADEAPSPAGAHAPGIGKMTTASGGSHALYDYPGEYAQRFDGVDKGGKESPAGASSKRFDSLWGLRSLDQLVVGSVTDAGSATAASAGGKPRLRAGAPTPSSQTLPAPSAPIMGLGSASTGPVRDLAAPLVPRAAPPSNPTDGKSSTWIRVSQPTTSGLSPAIGSVAGKGASPAPRIGIRK